MKLKWIAALAAIALWCVPAKAQDFVQSYNFVNTGTNGPTTSFANSGVTSFFISWSPQVSLSACSIQVDSSSDGASWGSGDLIASTSCTTAGSSATATLGAGKNFVRIHVTALTGNGGLNVTMKGWGGGGSGGGIKSVSTIASALPCTPGGTNSVIQLSVPPNSIYRCVAPLDGGANYFSPDYPNNVIDPTAYGARFDAHISDIPTLTNTSNIITMADGNFTGTDYLGRPIAVVGQQIFCTNATNDTSQATSTIILAQTTIQSIDSATQIHTVGNATASTTASGMCAWGDRDTAAAASVQSAANDPLFAAWTAAAHSCIPLIMPAGMAWVEQPEFNTWQTTDSCGNGNQVTNTRRGFSVQGQGPNETLLVIAPSLDPTKCTGPNNTSIGCYLSAPNMYLKGFQMTGLGNSAPGAGFAGKSLVFLSGFNPGVNFQVDSIYLFGFGAAQGTASSNTLTGLNVGNGVALAISSGTISNSIVEAWGSLSTRIAPGSGGVANIGLTNFWSVVGNTTLEVENGAGVNDVNGLYGFTTGTNTSTGTACVDVNVTNGVIFNATNTEMPYAGCSGAGAMHLHVTGTGTTANLTNGLIANVAAGNVGVSIDSGATFNFSNTFISAPFAIFMAAVNNCGAAGACKIADSGTNKIVGTTTPYTDAAGTTVVGYGATIGGNPYGARTNCNPGSSVSPAACGSALTGTVVVPTTTTTYTVNTTAVTATSRIKIIPITDNSGLTGAPTCVAPPTPFIAYQSARVAGTSFTFTLPSTTGASCWNYVITD